jgi:rhodanese-related sulfurtransferase
MTQSVSAGLGLRKSRIALIAGAAFLLVFGGWAWWFSARGADLDSIERIVRKRYPSVQQLSTAELAGWLKSGRPKPVLLDVRETEEFAVSHLPGARNVPPKTDPATLLKTLPKDTPIVTYCSVGWRSSEFAQKLKEAGYTQVQNLEGSIFRWANEDRPLEKDGKPAEKVHPYSATWSRLVKPEKRAALK